MTKRARRKERTESRAGRSFWWMLFGLAGLGVGVWVFRSKRSSKRNSSR